MRPQKDSTSLRPQNYDEVGLFIIHKGSQVAFRL